MTVQHESYKEASAEKLAVCLILMVEEAPAAARELKDHLEAHGLWGLVEQQLKDMEEADIEFVDGAGNAVPLTNKVIDTMWRQRNST